VRSRLSRASVTALLAVTALLLLGAGKRPPGLGDVTEIRLFEHEGYTRVVVELSRPARYGTHLIGNPPRLYIDIEGTWIEAPQRAEQAPPQGGPIVKVRGGQNTLRRARIVLDLQRGKARHRTFHLERPFRIVTDVYGDRPPVIARQLPGSDFDSRPVRRVVIDPGHGGKDPGAIGRGRVVEKDVVLRISRQLRRRLEAQGLEVFLTRDGDRYLTLEERAAFANRLGADLFVSIHANASRNRASHGVESYLLDTRYDRQTARVAARENGVTVGQLNEVQRILASLRLGYNERYAAPLAQKVQAALIERLRRDHAGTRNLGVKRGPFLVLFMADMPAVLVEVGFVTHPKEARRLGTKAFAQSAADGIAEGILAYRGEHARRLVAGR
jgi:N-acetylmuramoyl-L-alanine amidase